MLELWEWQQISSGLQIDTSRSIKLGALMNILDLARSDMITLSQAGEILANTLRSYSLETSKANEVASQFIVASRLGTLNVIDLKNLPHFCKIFFGALLKGCWQSFFPLFPSMLTPNN